MLCSFFNTNSNNDRQQSLYPKVKNNNKGQKSLGITNYLFYYVCSIINFTNFATSNGGAVRKERSIFLNASNSIGCLANCGSTHNGWISNRTTNNSGKKKKNKSKHYSASPSAFFLNKNILLYLSCKFLKHLNERINKKI